MNDQQVQILLKEYEVCNADAAGINARLWQYTAILAVIVAALGGFVAQSGRLRNESFDVDILGVGIDLATLSLVWPLIFERSHRIRQTVFYRMREIEVLLGMRKNLYVHAADNWKKLDEEKPPRSL